MDQSRSSGAPEKKPWHRTAETPEDQLPRGPTGCRGAMSDAGSPQAAAPTIATQGMQKSTVDNRAKAETQFDAFASTVEGSPASGHTLATLPLDVATSQETWAGFAHFLAHRKIEKGSRNAGGPGCYTTQEKYLRGAMRQVQSRLDDDIQAIRFFRCLDDKPNTPYARWLTAVLSNLESIFITRLEETGEDGSYAARPLGYNHVKGMVRTLARHGTGESSRIAESIIVGRFGATRTGEVGTVCVNKSWYDNQLQGLRLRGFRKKKLKTSWTSSWSRADTDM